MYVPKPFAETRVDTLHELMRAHPLATLVTQTADGLDANHIPFEIVATPAPFGTLRCHITRANPLWREHKSDTEALAIFRAADAYISPNWYATKSTDGKVVPTWNYAVVHAHGTMQIIEDHDWLRELVTRLTDRHETGNAAWKVTDAPPNFITAQLDAIIGIEIPITRLIGKYKTNQNRPAKDRISVVEGLRKEGNEAMAEMVRRRNK